MPSSAPSTSKLKKSTVGKSKAARRVKRGRQSTSTTVFTFEPLKVKVKKKVKAFEPLNFPTILALFPSWFNIPLRFELSIASNFTFIGDFWVERQTFAECALKQHLLVVLVVVVLLLFIYSLNCTVFRWGSSFFFFKQIT